MTIKQNGGIFGRNPEFNSVAAQSVSVTGSVGIGTTPSQKLHVSNGSSGVLSYAANTDVIIEDDGNAALQFATPNDKNQAIYFSDPESNTSGLIQYSHADDSLKFQTGGAEAATFTSSGNLAFPSGQGIDFSATSGTGTSELFDDYEEGTWTPVPADAASGGNTGTASTQQGEYTKIGKLVFLKCFLQNIDTTGLTAGNDFYIQGLPFVAENTAVASRYTGSVDANLFTFSGTVTAGILDNTSSIELNETISGSNVDRIIVSEISSGSADINVNVCYLAK